MRAFRLLPLLALTGLVLLAAPVSAASSSAAASAAVQDGGEAKIVDFDFSPRRLTVAAGSKVTWSNTGQRPAHGHRPGRQLRHQADRPRGQRRGHPELARDLLLLLPHQPGQDERRPDR